MGHSWLKQHLPSPASGFQLCLGSSACERETSQYPQALSKEVKEVRATSRALSHQRGNHPGTSCSCFPLPFQKPGSRTGHRGFSSSLGYAVLTVLSVLKKHSRKQKQHLEVLKGWLIFSPKKLKTVVCQEENKLSTGCQAIVLLFKL